MKKPIVCVFAHPDDEAFGPGGTIAAFARTRDVYIICTTNGDAGKNYSKKTQELGEIRKNELLQSANVLGVKNVFFLGYKDGSLCNNLYHELAQKIQNILETLKPDTLLTFEPRGISGHIDHITVSMVTTYVFEHTEFVKTILYYCITEQSRALMKAYFIYFPQGYKTSEIDKIVDTQSVWSLKVKAMRCHESQIHDVARILHNQERLPKKEYFIVEKK